MGDRARSPILLCLGQAVPEVRDQLPVPRDRRLDSTLALLSEGYEFIRNGCRRHRSDIFETRLLLRRAICISGEEAARMFYEPGRFTRRGAIPATTLTLLQDKGGVATLDDEAHQHRKAMFLSLMEPEAVEALADRFEGEWTRRQPDWEGRREIVLFDEMTAVLTRAVCGWAGVPLDEREADARTSEFAAMIDGAGALGPRNWRGQWKRRRSERWARRAIADLRSGRLKSAQDAPAAIIAKHRDELGRLLPASMAAVELLNLLRPTVAVDRFVTFAALAIHDHPQVRERLVNPEDEYLGAFAQEVRRYYPFVPIVAGRAVHGFEWRSRPFSPGEWVLLDLYGTNRDPRSWRDPDAFNPDRFLGRPIGPFELVPQGGGDHRTGHRCPGEWITIAVLKRAARLLTAAMRYDVPDQNLSVRLNRFPTLPRSGFVITNVRALDPKRSA